MSKISYHSLNACLTNMMSCDDVICETNLLSASNPMICRCFSSGRPAFGVKVFSKQCTRRLARFLESQYCHMLLPSIWQFLSNQHLELLYHKMLKTTSFSFHSDGCPYSRLFATICPSMMKKELYGDKTSTDLVSALSVSHIGRNWSKLVGLTKTVIVCWSLVRKDGIKL